MGNFGVNSSKEKVILLPTRKLNIIFTVGCGTALRNIFFFSQKIKQEHSSHSPRGLQKKRMKKGGAWEYLKQFAVLGMLVCLFQVVQLGHLLATTAIHQKKEKFVMWTTTPSGNYGDEHSSWKLQSVSGFGYEECTLIKTEIYHEIFSLYVRHSRKSRSTELL